MAYLPFHEYQLEAIEHCIRFKHAMLFGSIGSGKTAVAMEILRRLKNRLAVSKALIVAPPKVVIDTYKKEATKWDDFKYLKVKILHGPHKNEQATQKADIYVVSYDSLEWLFSLKNFKFDAIILDESHYVKNKKSKRFKLFKKHIAFVPYIVEMTGSPIGNHFNDLWSQYFLLDGGQRLFRSYDTFMNYWFKAPYKGYVWAIKRGAKEKITKRVSDITYEIPASKVALPELRENTILLKFPRNLQEDYDILQAESIVRIKNEAITAFNIGTLLQKLRQFASGFIYGEEETIFIHDIKIKALEKRLNEAGNRIMIVANFKKEFAMLRDSFPGIEIINGDTSDKETSKIIDGWNSKAIDLLAVHPKSAGTGLNLQEGGHRQIWYSPDWSLLDRNQTIGRLYRQGQKSNEVIVDNIIVADTIEEVIMSAIKQKIATTEDFIKELRKYWGIV